MMSSRDSVKRRQIPRKVRKTLCEKLWVGTLHQRAVSENAKTTCRMRISKCPICMVTQRTPDRSNKLVQCSLNTVQAGLSPEKISDSDCVRYLTSIWRHFFGDNSESPFPPLTLHCLWPQDWDHMLVSESCINWISTKYYFLRSGWVLRISDKFYL